MLSYTDFTKHFGTSLFDEGFQLFLKDTFSGLTEYNALENDYITFEKNGIDLGFTNNQAVYDDGDNIVFEKANPIFSHFILYIKSLTLIDNLPFDATFNDNRLEVIRKAGSPTQTKEGYADFLKRRFIVDNFKVDQIIITFDYEVENQTINFIQIRDNNLVEHLRL